MTRQELEAKLAELEAANATLAAQAATLAAAQTKGRAYSGITLKVSENAKCLSIYGLQSRPVTMYASQFAKVLVTHVDEIKAFIIANADALAWKSDAEKTAALTLLRPVAVAPIAQAEPVAEPVQA